MNQMKRSASLVISGRLILNLMYSLLDNHGDHVAILKMNVRYESGLETLSRTSPDQKKKKKKKKGLSFPFTV